MKKPVRTSTQPLNIPRTTRVDELRVLTSFNPGEKTPFAYVPLLREDAVRSGRFRVNAGMMETAERLMNGVKFRVQAHFVPFLALERFNGMDSFNNSYAGIPDIEGGAVTPFIETQNWADNPIYRAMGIHGDPSRSMNTALIESYNLIVNHERSQISDNLPTRARLQSDLAECLWSHSVLRNIVPDYDAAIIDGEFELNIKQNMLPVRGIGLKGGATVGGTTTVREADNSVQTYDAHVLGSNSAVAIEVAGIAPAIFAEMAEAGITAQLSTIEQAKKMRSFAQLRKNFEGHDEDHLIDLLMSGVRIPETALRQPILLAEQETVFGYQSRFASDGASLDKSVTTGETSVDLAIRLPAVNTGGIILFTCEAVPEQLWERQLDYFLNTAEVKDFPEYLRDELDTDKVDIVLNEHIDVLHTDAQNIFGYAPKNHGWMRRAPKIGGKYFRPTTNTAFDEERQKIWAVETVDPTLTADLYLCTQMHKKVFMDTNADAFELMAAGSAEITGHTVFGPALFEASTGYEDMQTEHGDGYYASSESEVL